MVFNLCPTNLINLSRGSSKPIFTSVDNRRNTSIDDKVKGNEVDENSEQAQKSNQVYDQYGGKVVRDDEYGTVIEYVLASIYDKNTEAKGEKETEREDISGQKYIQHLPELPEDLKKYMQYKIVKVKINRERNLNKNRIPNLLDYTHKNKTKEYQFVYEGIKDYLKDELSKKDSSKTDRRLGSLDELVDTEIGEGSIVFENGEKYGQNIKDSEELIEAYKKFEESEFAKGIVKHGLKEIPKYDGYASLDLGENVLAAVISYGDKEVLAINSRYQEKVLQNPELYNRIFVHEAIHRLGDKSEYSTRLKEQKIYDRIANDKDIGEIEKMLGGRYSSQVDMELQNPKSYEMN